MDEWTKKRPDATDRCDHCQAQAYVVTKVKGTILLWCVHDWRRFEDKLVLVAERVWDYSFLLSEEVKP